MPGAVRGFLSSNKRPYGLVAPAGAVLQLSSAVMNVPQGVQYEASNATWLSGVGAYQTVSTLPVRRSRRCTPPSPVSNTVNRKRPGCAPVSLTVIMSKLPEFGMPAASCELRSATDRCCRAGLPKVIGDASSAAGVADAASGSNSEKRVLSA